ncbi:MAG: integrase [Gammaproteobacteria bacterium]|nr:integrase [Gammaproteobacteria bacterium]|tara:strand:- start:5676 stop:6920 length:1245 start_codon:yes stop_codon:yes gene_type:complete
MTEAEIIKLEPSSKKQTISLGNSLFLMVIPIHKGGGKAFTGRTRVPPGRRGKQVDVHIGTYGKGFGEISLKKAREEWNRIRLWAKETGRDPRDLYKEERSPSEEILKTKSLQEAVDAYLERSGHSPSTLKDYKNKLFNQVIPALGADTDLKELEWSQGGREKVLGMKLAIEKRGSLSQSDRVLMITRMVFDFSIDMGWMENPNPAISSKHSKSAHIPKSNPSLKWDQLPKFFEDFETRREKTMPLVMLATQLTMLSFLRVGALAQTEWTEIDEDKLMWTVPASKMKAKRDHLIPITPQIKRVFERMYEINGDQQYVFYTVFGKTHAYMNPSSINRFLKDLGYAKLTTAHGFRSLALTAGQEVLKFDAELIQRQMSHAIGDKVRQAYDKAQFIEERKEFMLSWDKALAEQGMKID